MAQLKNRFALATALAALAALSVACAGTIPVVSDPVAGEGPPPATAASEAMKATAASQAPSAGAMVRLDPNAAPTAQRVTLRLDPEQPSYQGSTTIELTIHEPLTEVLFHAEGQTFDGLTLTGPGGEVEVEVAREDQGLVRLRAAGELEAGGFEPGDYTLEIDFTQEFNTHAVGLYRAEYRGVWYLFTQLQSIDGRKAFPCWDEPGYKIPYQLTVAAPEGMTVATNTPATSTESAGGWTTTEFAPTPPTPSYLLAIAVGPFETLDVPGVAIPARILTVEGFSDLAEIAAGMTAPILSALEDYFGGPYPYDKLDQIAVPEFWPGAMENPGLITYADRILLQEPEAGSRQRRRLAQVMAHELAHMWFGDLVTMEWWDDLWLNESFAAWMENRIPEQLYPELRAGLDGRTATQAVMARDSRPSARAVRREVVTPHDIFAGISVIYEKGAGVLTMVEQWLGEEAFRDGVRLYMDRHAWGNATSDDFWAALSEASGEDVASILTGFVLQPGVPLVQVERRDGEWWLSQERFHAAGAEVENMTWKIPVTLSYAAGGEVGDQAVVLTGEAVKLAIPEDASWILPDAGARGYYRWAIPAEQMRNLSRAASTALRPRERVAILDNASALLDAGLMPGSEYLRLLETFSADEDPDVLSGMLDGVEKVGESFVSDENRDAFAGYLRATLRPIADRLGWQRAEGEIETTHILRRRVFEALGTDGEDPEVRALAREMTEQFLVDRSSVDAELASRALRIAAIDGDEQLFDRFQERFENPESPQDRGMFLAAMARFSDPGLRERVRAYGLSEAVKPSETFSAYGGDSTDAEALDSMLWFFDHYDGFESKISAEFRGFFPGVASGCSRERLELATEFFSDPAHQVPGTLRTLQQVSEQVEECLVLREREGAEVSAYLGQFAG